MDKTTKWIAFRLSKHVVLKTIVVMYSSLLYSVFFTFFHHFILALLISSIFIAATSCLYVHVIVQGSLRTVTAR